MTVIFSLFFYYIKIILLTFGIVYGVGTIHDSEYVIKAIDKEDIPDYVHVVFINEGPHTAENSRHGDVVTVTLNNTHEKFSTPYTLGHDFDTSQVANHTYSEKFGHSPPLWLGCMLTNGRVVAMPMDWIVGPEGYPSFPIIPPKTVTMEVDFRAQFGVMEEPINAPIKECKVGGSKHDAEVQFFQLWQPK